MHRRNFGFDGRRFGRGHVDLSMAVKNGRESFREYSGRDGFDLHAVKFGRRNNGLPGNRQFGRQRLFLRRVGHGDCDHPRSDFDYDPAGRF